LATRRRPLLDVLVRHRAALGDEDIVGDDRLAAGALEADGVPVVDDFDVLAWDEQPASLWRAFDALALDWHGGGEPVAMVHAAREEAAPRPAIAAVDRHHVAHGVHDRRGQRVRIAPQLFL